jgi:hypothetical protein
VPVPAATETTTLPFPPDMLADIGRALYGEHWRMQLARARLGTWQPQWQTAQVRGCAQRGTQAGRQIIRPFGK